MEKLNSQPKAINTKPDRSNTKWSLIFHSIIFNLHEIKNQFYEKSKYNRLFNCILFLSIL